MVLYIFKRFNMSKIFFTLLTFCLLISLSVKSQVVVSNLSLSYSEDFNTLANTGTSSVTPTGWFFLETGASGNTTYAADGGGGTGGNVYSYGSTAADRAFGTIQSSNVIPTIGVQFSNTSGTTITSINVTYTGEQWRLGTLARLDKLDFQYSLDATALNTGAWIDQDNLDFTAPVTGPTVGGVNGNVAPNKTLITFNITGLSIPTGSTFWFRWNDLNASNADDGLAIDDFGVNFNGNATPPCAEPTNQPLLLNSTATPTTIAGSFTRPTPLADEYLVIRSLNSTLSNLPLDGTVYNVGQSIGGGTVVSSGTDTTFNDMGLTGNTNYFYFIFASNSEGCIGGPNYLTTAPLSEEITTLPLSPCTVPPSLPTALVLTPSNNNVTGSFTPATGANRYLVVRSTSNTLSVNPVNGTAYAVNDVLGNGTVVAYGTATTFIATGLNVATLYYFFVFSANGDCSGEPNYTTTSLKGNTTTTNTSTGIPVGYYDAAAGLTCSPLKTALFNKISSNTTTLSYSPGVWNAYNTTDLHRNDANTADIIWDIYTDNPSGAELYTFNAITNRCGQYDREGVCYNREHSFPQAWFGPSTLPMYSDIHHVFPTDGWANGKHDNNPYSEVGTATYTSSNGSKLGNNTFPGFSGTVFEPIDAYKGDVARATLYMVTRYEDKVAGWKNNGNANDILNGTAYPALDDWYIKLLYKWHVLDPVSTKEINRNNAIYALQRNRNPFVDHPEYVELIWQCTGLIPVTLIDFKATKSNNGILLNWAATRETNFKQFEIERSVNGINFNTAGIVNGQNLAAYSFEDIKLPKFKTLYYRLKMVDEDGKFKYSKIVSVRLNDNFSNAILYPNPAKNDITIELQQPLTENGILQITDIAGRVLQQQPVNGSQNTIKVNIKQLPAGRYFVSIKNKVDFIRESVVIIR